MKNIFYITGVNGIGKTTLISQLTQKLNIDIFEIHDFDERGVPDNADKTWRKSETLHWTQVGKENTKKGSKTIICGFMKFSEILDSLEKEEAQGEICLLDANEEIITERILGRYKNNPGGIADLNRAVGKTPEKFASDNVWISSQFRDQAKESGYFIIDTSNLSPEEVGKKVIDWIELS
ncbi:hypothetical protein N9L18_00690 [Candidatus Pacebacteria bacterium]|nr:hypothetical protein [Candidatus Paceibacterota bacterium]